MSTGADSASRLGGLPTLQSEIPASLGLPDYLPISHLNAYVYCPRRFYYEFVEAEMLVDAAVLEGRLRHVPTDVPGASWEGAVWRLRRAYVYSERLRLAGFCDLVEETEGMLRPVEYKRGRAGRWRNDHIQLCAQALCLEERTGEPVPDGWIFYWANPAAPGCAVHA